jgi:hypothetical protein
MVEEYPEHDIPSEFTVPSSHNLLDVATKDIKQIVYIHALKQMLVFWKGVDIESDTRL